MTEEGNNHSTADAAQGFIPGPEGPGGSMQQRREYEAAMARLDQPQTLTPSQRSRACIEDLKLWISSLGIDSSNLEELLVQDVVQERQDAAQRGQVSEEQNLQDSKTSLLIDLMVKNQLQDQCGKEMIQVLEQISLENQESTEQNFPIHMLSKSNLSAAAQRNFDNLMKVLAKTETGARTDFAQQIESQIHSAELETVFYEMKTKQVNLNIDKILNPKWNAKLCLRDTLQRIYDGNIKNQERELSLQSLKIQQETRQKLSNLRDAQAEANQAAATTGDSKEQLDVRIAEIETLAGQQQQIEDQIACMNSVMEREFAGLDPDILKARKQVALLRDQLIAKEEEAAAAAQQK